MTEASENAYVVRVRAQVMCRDEATGGWVALGGGGLAHVCVGRRPHPVLHPRNGSDSNGDSSPLHEYYIHGRRISDNMVVLECTIKKDFQYNKVMPTFHHWVTDEKRFGLTFQTAADARAFDKGVKIAVQELLHGLGGAFHAYTKMYSAPTYEDDEQNIFECLNLPGESRSSSETSSNSRRRTDELTQTPILCAITLPSHDEPLNIDDNETCSYVHLSATHEYTYPQVGSGIISSERSSPNTKPPLVTRDSDSLKKQYSGPPLPDKKPKGTVHARLRCRHCHTWYMESMNEPGSCEYAPDYFKSCIECVSCYKCAQCAVYHCAADGEGDARTCACAPRDAACAHRWMGITLLSLLVPCLCCYLPLRGVHRAARALHLPRAAHEPARAARP